MTGSLGGCCFGDYLALPLIKLVLGLAIASGARGPAHTESVSFLKAGLTLGQFWSLSLTLFGDRPIGDITGDVTGPGPTRKCGISLI